MSKNECQYADWYQVGLEDGAQGKGLQQLGRYRKSCAKAAITPDVAEYERGHAKGLHHYCNYQNGLQLGNRGGQLPGFCPDDKRQQFELGYDHGRERHAQRAVINSIASEMDRLQQLANRLQERKQWLEELIVANGSSKNERVRALNEMRDIDRQMRALTADHALLSTQHSQEALLLQDIVNQQRGNNW